MAGWVIRVVDVVLFVVLLFAWVHWTERERDVFRQGQGHHLE